MCWELCQEPKEPITCYTCGKRVCWDVPLPTSYVKDGTVRAALIDEYAWHVKQELRVLCCYCATPVILYPWR